MRYLFVTLLSALAMVGVAQNISGETAEGKTVQLPAASKGRYSLVAVAASKKAEPALQEWFGPAYQRFVAKQGLLVPDGQVDLWFVPVFTGLNKAAFGPSMKRLKAEADPEAIERVVFVKDDSAALLQVLGITEREQPHFFVFDTQGHLVHREQGDFTVDKLDALTEAMP